MGSSRGWKVIEILIYHQNSEKVWSSFHTVLESEVFCRHRVSMSNTRKSAVEQGNEGQYAIDTEWVCLSTMAIFVLLVTQRVE